MPRKRHQKPGARIFVRSTSFVCSSHGPAPAGSPCNDAPRQSGAATNARKNFFAKRRMRAGRCAPAVAGQTSPTLESWRKLVMRNRSVCFVGIGERGHSARCRRHSDGGSLRAPYPNCPVSWRRLVARDAVKQSGTMPIICFAQDAVRATTTDQEKKPVAETERIVVSATRFDIPLDQSPSSVTEITSQDLELKQIERVSDALREVPGLSVVQSGAPGQLTSVFTRGLNSAHTQVLLDGIPINQGLAGQFDFANLTTDNIDRIEVVRGSQSTIYGPRAMAGVIQIFTKRGEGTPGLTLSGEGGSYGTFRESLQSDGGATIQSRGGVQKFDYSIGISRLDTDNARPNNQYRNTAGISDIGYSPDERLRVGALFTYSNSDTGNPNTIFNPRPVDNFLTEKWLIAPHVDLRVGDWWEHKIIFSYDHERPLNDPNQDGFVGAARAVFERTTID